MIYSKKMQNYIPVTVEKVIYDNPKYPKITKYIVKDRKIPVGRVSVTDLKDGVFVDFIENYHPDLYRGFGVLADQIEVEHCLNRGLNNFGIYSNAGLNSHALHYLRGKRFVNDAINKLVNSIIQNTPKGEQYYTKFLGSIKMYMPKEIIKHYIEVIKKSPLL